MSSDRKHVLPFKPGTWKRVESLCWPLAVAVIIRVIGAAWLMNLLSHGGTFHTPWMDANPDLIIGWTPIPLPSGSLNWLWLFNAYDSPHFPLIAMLGYEHPNYVYPPGYPALIHVAGLLTGSYWFGAFLVTQIFAFASIVIFQLLAEEYMPQREALYAALVMSTFPYVSVFMTLGYSESVFLFFTILAWYLHRKGRIGASAAFAGVASITRIYGFAIVLPIFLGIIKMKRYRKLFYLMIPTGFLASWILFCYISTGDPLVSWTDQKYWIFGSKFSLGQYVLSHVFHGIEGASVFDPAILVSVALFCFLILKIWQIDQLLWVYAVSLFISLIFTTVDHLSLLRYFSFIFPVWLTLKVRNPIVVAACVVFFAAATLILWLYTLSAIFIG